MADEEPSKQELASERTDWARVRTALANQRTFAAWIRTGLAGVAFGFAALRLLQDVDPAWLAAAVGAAPLLLGLAALLLGARSYRATEQRIHADRPLLRFDPLGALASLFALVALAAYVLFALR